METKEQNLWPIVEMILGKVDRREVDAMAMISALLFTAIFLAFAIELPKNKLLQMMLGRWTEMELAEGRTLWGTTGEA